MNKCTHVHCDTWLANGMFTSISFIIPLQHLLSENPPQCPLTITFCQSPALLSGRLWQFTGQMRWMQVSLWPNSLRFWPTWAKEIDRDTCKHPIYIPCKSPLVYNIPCWFIYKGCTWSHGLETCTKWIWYQNTHWQFG